MGTSGLGLYRLYKGDGCKDLNEILSKAIYVKESEVDAALLNGYWTKPAEALAAMSEPEYVLEEVVPAPESVPDASPESDFSKDPAAT